MIISEETGWITGVQFLSINNVLEINAAVPRLQYDQDSRQIAPDCVHYVLPYNVNVPEKLDLDGLRDRKVKITVELIDNDEK